MQMQDNMGKSQFKIAADLVVEDCLANGYRNPGASGYYWAYIKFFREISTTFDVDRFIEYIRKRI